MLLGLVGCTDSPQTLATFDGGAVTVQGLAAHLSGLPENARQVPPDGEAAKIWLEQRIRRLALEEVLANSREMASLSESPEIAAQALWLRTAALERALSRQLAGAARPTAEQVSALVAELAVSSSKEPVLNFRHLYLRLDLASSPRQRQAKRQLAERLLAQLHGGADFAELAREHSDSAGAATGGLVTHARPSDLEETSRAAITALEEEQLSPVVETRTGLHIFRLVRRLQPQPTSQAQLSAAAERTLSRQAFGTARANLLEGLRQGQATELDAAVSPWRIGHFTLDGTLIAQLLPADDRAGAQDRLVERLLLASEAIDRGLEDEPMREATEKQRRALLLERLLQRRRRALIEALGPETLRPFYDAQPSLFNLPARARVELIFVPQGRDSFATQQQVEGYVAQLRGGASFAELARRHSRGPGAEQGGDLGLLAPVQWGQLGPAVGAVVPQLEIGTVSDPIYCTDRIMTQQPGLLRGGFAVLRVGERQPEEPRSFEQAIDDVRLAFARDRQRELDRQLEESLLEEADFRMVRWPELAELSL